MMTAEEHTAHLALDFPDEDERTFYLHLVNTIRTLTGCVLINAHASLSPHIHEIWERVHRKEADADIEADPEAIRDDRPGQGCLFCA